MKSASTLFIKNNADNKATKNLIALLADKNFKPLNISNEKFQLNFDENSEWVSINLKSRIYSNSSPKLKEINFEHGSYVKYVNSKGVAVEAIIKTPDFDMDKESIYVQNLKTGNLNPIRKNKIVCNMLKVSYLMEDVLCEDDYTKDTYLYLDSDIKEIEKKIAVDYSKLYTAFTDDFEKSYEGGMFSIGSVINPEVYNDLKLDSIGFDKDNGLFGLEVDARFLIDGIAKNTFKVNEDLLNLDVANLFNDIINGKVNIYHPLRRQKYDAPISDLLTDDVCKSQKLFKLYLNANWELTSPLVADDIEMRNNNDQVITFADIEANASLNCIISFCIKNTEKFKLKTKADYYLDTETDSFSGVHTDDYDISDLELNDLKVLYKSINEMYFIDRNRELFKIYNSCKDKIKRELFTKQFKENFDEITLSRKLKPIPDATVEAPVVVDTSVTLNKGEFYIRTKSFEILRGYAKWLESLGITQYAYSLDRNFPLWIDLDAKNFRSSKPISGDILCMIDNEEEFKTSIKLVSENIDVDSVILTINKYAEEIAKSESAEEGIGYTELLSQLEESMVQNNLSNVLAEVKEYAGGETFKSDKEKFHFHLDKTIELLSGESSHQLTGIMNKLNGALSNSSVSSISVDGTDLATSLPDHSVLISNLKKLKSDITKSEMGF